MFPPGNAASEGIDPDALAKLIKRAEESNSDALVVVKNGKLIGEWYFGKSRSPIEAMSATKSIVNLAVGKLIDDDRIKSLDQPVAGFFPEWKQGRKKKITIRHLLNHTSGLQNERSAAVEIYPSPDSVQLTLAAELSHEPGKRFAYNNKAANLIAGVVKAASGKRRFAHEPIGRGSPRTADLLNMRGQSRDVTKCAVASYTLLKARSMHRADY